MRPYYCACFLLSSECLRGGMLLRVNRHRNYPSSPKRPEYIHNCTAPISCPASSSHCLRCDEESLPCPVAATQANVYHSSNRIDQITNSDFSDADAVQRLADAWGDSPACEVLNKRLTAPLSPPVTGGRKSGYLDGARQLGKLVSRSATSSVRDPAAYALRCFTADRCSTAVVLLWLRTKTNGSCIQPTATVYDTIWPRR